MADLHTKQLTDKQAKRLSAFLLEHTDYSMLQLMGFFSAITSSPRSIPLNEWLERLDVTKAFSSQKEAQEILADISTLFNVVAGELRDKKYKPIGLTTLQESKLPAHEKTDLFLDWLDGYLLGMDLVGNEWVHPDHAQAVSIMAAIMNIARSLYDDEARPVTQEDFETVQQNVKAFHDYWIKHGKLKTE